MRKRIFVLLLLLPIGIILWIIGWNCFWAETSKYISPNRMNKAN